MTKEQKAKELISKIKFEGSYSDWVQWIGEGLEEYAALKCQQDKNFTTRLKASIDRIYHKSGLKDLALNGSRGQYEETERKFFDAMDGITLEHLQGIESSLASYAGSADNWQPIATAPKDGTTIEVSYDREHTDTCLAMWSKRPVCMGGPTVYFKPGWATPPEAECDTNLPIDPPLFWRPYAGSAAGEKERPCNPTPDSDALMEPPSFEQMVGLIKKNFRDVLELSGIKDEGRIAKAWERYKCLNHLYQDRETEKKDPWIERLVGHVRDELYRLKRFPLSEYDDGKLAAYNRIMEYLPQPPAATNQEGGKE